jgi:hypothetical protein
MAQRVSRSGEGIPVSARAWIISLGAAAVWFLFFVIGGMPTDSALQECIAREDAADAAMKFSAQGQLGNLGGISFREVSPGVFRRVRPYRQICAAYLEENASKSASFGFWSSATFIGILFVVHGVMRKRQREEFDKQEVIRAVKAQTKTEIIMGDVFKNISNSSIINRSDLEKSIQTTQTSNPDVSNALAEIAKIVAATGNKDAEEHLNRITEEVGKPKPNKSLLRTFWIGLKELAPVLKTAVDITSALDNFIGLPGSPGLAE